MSIEIHGKFLLGRLFLSVSLRKMAMVKGPPNAYDNFTKTASLTCIQVVFGIYIVVPLNRAMDFSFGGTEQPRDMSFTIQDHKNRNDFRCSEDL